MNDTEQFRHYGPVIVLCTARTYGPALTLLRHLHAAGAVVVGSPAGRTGGGPEPLRRFEVDHIEPSTDRLHALTPVDRGMQPFAFSLQ
ncbi:MAG TPA: hypothetical protein PLY66_08605 [Acidobacteriota bacterium]|nr:hypothetical protein [Acidobacteriota bacterium]HQF88231.1 hypothetical protein [Acidobacteriota bacterium]HQG92368.1 hypothetical protein [Acidobacteriota bacterium]HQK88211.1 hypothetical protein [Acidobacteriota bacterium]